MKSLPLVSVLVPVYNGARFLREALLSAQRQTYRHLEVVIRDEGSGDESRSIAESFCDRDARFTFIDGSDRRLGGTGNMVELLGLASGEFIKFLHQDDLLAATCIERLVRPMRFDSAITLATSSRRLIDETGAALTTAHPAYRPLQRTNGKLAGPGVVRQMLGTLTNQLGEPSVGLFRNGVVPADSIFVLDGRTYSYSNDMALWTNLLLAGELYWHAEPLSSFRRHGTQRSSQLHESITVIGELADYLRFGLEHDLVDDASETVVSRVRWLSGVLGQLHGDVSRAPVEARDDLAACLADALTCVRHLLESSGRFSVSA